MLLKQDGYKINFIDENDCFVGFDNQQDCCEDFGYVVTVDGNFCYGDTESDGDFDLSGYMFDTSFNPVEGSDDENECQHVTFKMIRDSGSIAYLTLYNSHNGYYCHGWEASWGCDGYL